MKINGLKKITTDVLIIGGGTAGCYAALTIREQSDAKIIIAEKANIKRSGCLAAGVNAINAYIVEGRKPEDYVDYAKKDADDIVREDLLLTMSERLNEVTAKMEKLGLVILKDENGKYVARGNRNIKINGENIKPILASAVEALEGVSVINRLNITDYIVKDGRILGAVGFNIDDGYAYEIRAKKVLCATGGAAGLYKPNNPGFSRHKMWYPPFNTGAGYAMGINAGAEMTTFEMRFIALRCKDTIAPTGTIAQGVGAKQVNSKGEVYEDKYGLTTSQRVYGTVRENIEGRGPCYLRTEGISSEQDESFEDVLSSLESSRITIENERREIEQYKQEIASLKSEMESKQEKLNEQRDRIIRQANEEAHAVLREAKEYADQTMKMFHKFQKDHVDLSAVEKERQNLRKHMNKAEKGMTQKTAAKKPKKELTAKDISLGDAVKVLSMNLKGTVSSRPDNKGFLFVQMGIIRSKVHISDLELIDEAEITTPTMQRTGAGKIRMSKAAHVSTEINLLGKTVDEAVAELDKYLDDAYIAHLKSVRIVHGKGTGALRKGVHNYLKRQKHVESFRLGEFGEGDAGVTIVEFKK